MKRRWSITALFLLVGSYLCISQAALIAYDPFVNANVGSGENDALNGEYNAGTQFRDFTNGSNEDVAGGSIVGWSSANLWIGNSGSSAGTNDKLIGPTDLTGLSYGNNSVQGGNVQARGKTTTAGTVSYARRPLDSYTGSSVYYISALFSADTSTINNNFTINAMTGFTASTSSGAFDGSSFVGALFGFHGDGSEVDLVVRHRDTTGTTINSTLLNGVSGDTTYFVVLKLEYNADGTNERLTAWVNPQSSTESGSTPVLTTTGQMLSSETQMTLAGFWINNFDSSATDYLQFDELRMGTEWLDAVAVPEPGTIGLFVISSVGLFFVRHIQR
ncbi:MAG: PEP-CTERM sorting domain-containing protein [Kiritimatiellales bacterium]